jgi:hypothetical protein
MTGVLKSLFSAVIIISGFVAAISVLGSAWPTWLLVVTGFVGGNLIVTVTTLAFVKEWAV